MDLFADFAYESLHKYGEELCGDKVEFERTDKFSIAVLADGLGSGVKANILSTLTSKIIATMLSSGATLNEAVDTIASTLPVCSQRGVAYSTFTIIHVENDGRAYLAEFDNPELVYLKDGVVTPFDRKEETISGKQIFTSELQLEEGDMLIAFSDGVVHAGVGSLLDLGWQYDNIVNYIRENITGKMSPIEVSRKILLAVNTLYMQKCGDDSTVCTIKMKQNTPVTIMVGPPVDPASDEIVVKKLMENPGKKVVCGGTTSQIVSKYTGKPLEVSLDYENPAVPPTAKMEGIDLVTEGVLTLGKALEIIKSHQEATEDKWDTFSFNKKDGATLLAKMILEESTQVNFLVGRALNPAHQNPEMPISLGLKLNLIKELAALVSGMGKKVKLEYF